MTSEGALRDAFSEFGEVVSVKIPVDQATGMPRGFAFVEMADKFHGYDAIDNLDMTYMDGQIITVKESKPKGQQGGGSRGGGGFNRGGGGFNRGGGGGFNRGGGGGYNREGGGGYNREGGGGYNREGGYNRDGGSGERRQGGGGFDRDRSPRPGGNDRRFTGGQRGPREGGDDFNNNRY